MTAFSASLSMNSTKNFNKTINHGIHGREGPNIWILVCGQDVQESSEMST